MQQREYQVHYSSETEIVRQDLNYPISSIESQQSEHILVGRKGPSAVKQNHQPFCQLLPKCLWLACKQAHIIYYFVQSIFEYFKNCDPAAYGDIVSTSVLLLLVIFCIFFEVYARYRTYRNFTGWQDQDQQTQYLTWNGENKEWQPTSINNLTEGQIILVQRFLQTNPKLIPINLLPIAYQSRNRSMLINTTGIDKREDYRKITIMRPFLNMIKIDGSLPPKLHLHNDLFSTRIDYRFISSLGENFEAQLSVGENKGCALITNEDIVPAGVKISTEQYVIGIVMKQMRGNQDQLLLKALLKQNSISAVLTGYLKVTVVVNIILFILVYLINLILSEVTTNIGNNIGAYSYCMFLSFVPLFMNTVYITMHILIYIYRIISSLTLKQVVNLNYESKSIDELAQTDTLIMDDFFFFMNQRPFDTDQFHFVFNSDAPLTDNFHLILRVIEGAEVLQQHMAGHIIPLAKYFRLNPQKVTEIKNSKVKILKETVISENCINVKIKVMSHGEQFFYNLKFNDQPVISTIAKLSESSFKNEVEDIQHKWSQNQSLMFFIEIVELQSDLAVSSQLYKLYGIITFKASYDRRMVDVLKDQNVLERFNIVIMTNKTRRYIQHFLEKSAMKNHIKDSVILLDDKQEGQISHTIKNHRKTLRQRSRESKELQKQSILFMNSTMITYLSRKNIRQSLFKLAPYCKYIIFYNCSQFQKQICAVNLFKIFPQHLFLSNYFCDYPMFQWANLSISEKGASSQRLTTFVLSKYEQFPGLIMKEAVKSLQIIQCITSAHIFKNMFFLGANLFAFFMIFQGSTVNIFESYQGQLLYFYNFVFTICPHIYQLIKRPDPFIEGDLCKYVDYHEMVALNIKALVFGIVSSFLAVSMVQTEFANNLFTIVLIISVVSGNMFVLVVDSSKRKGGMVACILLQIVLALLLIIMVQLLQTRTFDFIMIGTNLDPSNIWFFLAAFVVIPLFDVLVLYAFSVGREIWLVQNHRQMSLKQYEESPELTLEPNTSEANTEMVVKVFKGPGKIISFEEELLLSP